MEVTPDEFERIKLQELKLPDGWSIDEEYPKGDSTAGHHRPDPLTHQTVQPRLSAEGTTAQWQNRNPSRIKGIGLGSDRGRLS